MSAQGAGPGLVCPCGHLAGTDTGSDQPAGLRRKPAKAARAAIPSALADCCGRHHGQTPPAPTPESLMRSRYSAFVLDLRPYLLATWHPDTRPADIEPPEPDLKWLGLELGATAVHPLVPGDPLPDWVQALSGPPPQAWGLVGFVARYKLGGRAHRLVEQSGFVQQGGLWLYVCALSEGGAASASD